MRPAKRIEITVDESGEVELEVFGVADGSCRSLTERFEKALGGSVTRAKKSCVKQQVKSKGEKNA